MPRTKQFKIDLPLYVDPSVEEPRWRPPKRGRLVLIETNLLKPGHKFSTRAHMSPESDARRMAGLFKTWANKYKLNKGITPMTKKAKIQRGHDTERGFRNKVRLTVAKEAREVQEMARRSAAQAMEIARAIMADPLERASDRLAAVNFITERAYGKATQTNVNAQVDTNGDKKAVSAKELDQRIEKAIRGVEELTGRAGKPNPSPDRSTHVRKRHRHTSGSTVH